jgi:hypothetical protein
LPMKKTTLLTAKTTLLMANSNFLIQGKPLKTPQNLCLQPRPARLV